jgi:hypothetical protein
MFALSGSLLASGSDGMLLDLSLREVSDGDWS